MTMIGTTLDKLGPPEPAIKLPEKDWRRIEATLGIEKPNPGIRCGVANNILLYLAPEPQLARVRPSQLRKSINKILKDARQLRADLVFEDDEEDQDDLQEWARAKIVFTCIRPRDREPLLSSLDQVIKTLEGDLASMPPNKGGRPRDATLYGLTHSLALAYCEATGEIPTVTYDAYKDQEPYRGRFLEFVQAVLTVFGPSLDKGNQALGKAVQRVLKDWRTQMVMDKS